MSLMFHLALGDAYGAGREFADPADVEANNDGKTYVENPIHPNLKPGRYTDDTQESIAVAEWLLAGSPFNQIEFADYLVKAFRRDPRPGYATNFYNLLSQCDSGADLVYNIRSKSDRAGGAMRAPVCGLLQTIDGVRDAAMFQASVTHATADGMNAAAAAALLVWACRHGQRRETLPAFLNETVGGYGWEEPWVGPVGNNGINAVRAALWAIVGDGVFMSTILKTCVANTGDVDTVAAIAMAAASMHPDIIKDLDPALGRNLEGGRYGWRYLQSLDVRLAKAFMLGRKPVAVVIPDLPDIEGPIDILDLFP